MAALSQLGEQHTTSIEVGQPSPGQDIMENREEGCTSINSIENRVREVIALEISDLPNSATQD